MAKSKQEQAVDAILGRKKRTGGEQAAADSILGRRGRTNQEKAEIFARLSGRPAPKNPLFGAVGGVAERAGAKPKKKLFTAQGDAGPTIPVISQREKNLQTLAQQNLQKGFLQGRKRGEELFGGGQNLQSLVGQNLQRLQAQATQGIAAPQFSRIRGAAEAGLASQQANALRQLRIQQGASGVRGAAAQAGALRAQQQGDIARRALESDLAKSSIALQQSGQQQLGRALNRERLGQLAAEFGTAGLQSQVFRGAQQQFLQEQALKAAIENRAAAEGEPAPDQSSLGGFFDRVGRANPFRKEGFIGAIGPGVGDFAGLFAGGPVLAQGAIAAEGLGLDPEGLF